MDIKKKRIQYKCLYRGTRELDLVMRSILEKESKEPSWGLAQWQLFETFIEESDDDLSNWIFASGKYPEKYSEIIQYVFSAMSQIKSNAKTNGHNLSLDQFLGCAHKFGETIKNILDSYSGNNQKVSGVIALFGNLGAGKTTFCREVLQTIFDDPNLVVPSPSFSLIQEYIYEKPDQEHQILHIDLYRLNSVEECLELDLLEAFSQHLCLIEWPERLANKLPTKRLNIYIENNNDKSSIRIEDNLFYNSNL